MITRARIVAAAMLFSAVSLNAQPARSRTSPAQADAVYGQLRARQADFSDPATRRLKILTEIWGNLGFYHAVPSAKHLRWDDVLVEAVRQLPSVRTDREFVAMLNRVVFAPLSDPLAYASIRPAISPSPIPPPLESFWIDSTTAYVRSANESNVKVARRLRTAFDSLTRTRPAQRLIIDLRTPIAGAFFVGSPWLGMWTGVPLARGADVSILHTTEAPVANGTWLITPFDSLKPLLPTISIPTVFFVNRTTYPAVERSLDAVRAHRRDVAVVFEESGEPPIIWDRENTPQAWYPDSILVSASRLPLLSADGALGSVVDVSSPVPVDARDVGDVARRALAARSAQSKREPYTLSRLSLTVDTITSGPLSREQRTAGVLKTWFTVLHFGANYENVGGEWQNVLAQTLREADAAPSDSAFYQVMRKMVARLNDTHVGVVHPLADGPFTPRRGYSVPAVFEWVDHRLLVLRVDTTQPSNGMHAGDEIVGVNGRSIRDIVSAERPYWSLSPIDADVPPFFLGGTRNSTVRLRLSSAQGVREVTMTRSRPFAPLWQASKFHHPPVAILSGNLGYIDLSQFTSPPALDSALNALAVTRGILLDVRAPGAYNAQDVVYRFLSEPMPCMRRIESVSYQGYTPLPLQSAGVISCTVVPQRFADSPTLRQPLVVMTSRNDISYGESLAQKLRIAKRATMVGQSTNGTFGWVDDIVIPGGATIRFSRGRELWPDGALYHRLGVVPDVPAKPTPAGLRSGRDEVYEVALATLRRLVAK